MSPSGKRTMREFDERHLYRILEAKRDEHGGNVYATERTLGLHRNAIYNVLVSHRPITEKVANAIGFKRKLQGRRCGATGPMKFVVQSYAADEGGKK